MTTPAKILTADMKTVDEHFRDWEAHAFGFGYGTGEPHTLAALKTFMSTVGVGEPPDRHHCYDHTKLGAALTPTVAWFLINALCRYGIDIIEYGTSPRYAWLTNEGKALRSFIATKSVDELVAICCRYDEGYTHCSPGVCNCGPHGYEAGLKCNNPFWKNR